MDLKNSKIKYTSATQIIGEWKYISDETYTYGDYNIVANWAYSLTFNDDGTVVIKRDGYVTNYQMWHNDSPVEYTCAYTIAETAEAGVYAITFSALPGAGECTVTGFALTNACSIVDVTFDSVSLVIDGTAQTFTK